MAQATMRGPLAAASSSTSVPYGAPSPSAWGTACSPSSSFSWSHCDFSRRAEAGAMASCARPLVVANSVRSGRNCRRVDALVVRSGFLGCWEEKSWPSLCCSFLPQRHQQRKRQGLLPVRAAAGPSDGVRWWEKEAGPNVHDIHSTQEFIDALSKAGDKLVVVEFFATWCGSCRALFPKFCKLAAEHENVDFLKVNFDENKPMCKSLNIKVLPFFHFYRGADGRLDAFSCSLSKLQKLKDAIATHNTDRCSIGPPLGVGDIDLTAPVSTSDQPAAAGTSR